MYLSRRVTHQCVVEDFNLLIKSRYSRITSNYEASALEILVNLEDMFPR